MTIEVRLPKFPECWETCGNCGQGEVLIDVVHVKPGDTVRCDDPLVTLETGKVALDIPAPQAGRILAVHVEEGDAVAEGAPIATLVPS